MVWNKKDIVRVLKGIQKAFPKRERYDGTLSQTMELVNKHPERMEVTDQQIKELKKRKQDKKK